MNTITKAEREQLIASCRRYLEAGMSAADVVHIAIVSGTGISRDRARSAVATAQRRMRGEAVHQREYIRRGINLDDASMERIAAIEAATGINGASAVVREALRRMAEKLPPINKTTWTVDELLSTDFSGDYPGDDGPEPDSRV